jgi:1,4-alpha-glucan branching enzyme
MKNRKSISKTTAVRPPTKPKKAVKAAVRPEAAASSTVWKTPAEKSATTVHLEIYAPAAQEVYIAGSFNDWRPSATAMLASGGGRWARDLALSPGRYEYLFLVDGTWVPDPSAKEYAPNPFGGVNSLLQVPE